MPLPSDPTNLAPGNIALSEVNETFKEINLALWEIWPEVNYFSFSAAAVALVLPEAIEGVRQFILPDLGSESSITWNGIDAAAYFGVTVLLLLSLYQNKEHRKTATGIKAAANFVAGVELTALTALGATVSGSAGLVAASALGPIGFAAAFGISFMISIDDAVRSTRRWIDFDYWLKDSLAEMAIKEKMIADLEKELQLAKTIPESKLSKLERWALNQKKRPIIGIRKLS